MMLDFYAEILTDFIATTHQYFSEFKQTEMVNARLTTFKMAIIAFLYNRGNVDILEFTFRTF